MKFDLQEDEKLNYLETTTWQEARSERLRIDDNSCQSCGSRRYLQVHHINRKNNDNPNPYTDLITLCDSCHKRIEDTIRTQTWKSGELDFSIISAEIDSYNGSEKMPACERIAITLMVSDRDGYLRYINDYLPILETFKWKWRQLVRSIGIEPCIDTETICKEIIGMQGRAIFSIKNGEYGEFSVVEKYI